MPSFSFKERFVPMVKDGSKRQTVRAYRKNNPKPGQLAYLFFGMRTKFCTRLLEPQPIISVDSIYISTAGELYLLHHYPLTADEVKYVKDNPDEIFNCRFTIKIALTKKERDHFAWSDGFRPEGSTLEKPAGSWELMLRYWKQHNSLPFIGTVTYW